MGSNTGDENARRPRKRAGGRQRNPVAPDRPGVVKKIFALLDARPDLTLKMVAEACGANDSTLIAWRDAGVKSEPSATQAFLLARLFGVSIEYLVNDDLATPPPRDAAAVAAGALADRVAELAARLREARLELSGIGVESRSIAGEVDAQLAAIGPMLAPPGSHGRATPAGTGDEPPTWMGAYRPPGSREASGQ